MPKKVTKVICKCYGKEQEFKNIEEAKAFFLECMMCSEGAERERYTEIYSQLEEGKTYCTDGWE
jgi:hypothetical protein